MRIQDMRELLAIAQYGNYSKAANHLYITQPALSRHITEMEKELGVRLLNRNKHTVALTEMGEKACRCFRRIVQNYDRFLDDLASFQSNISGTLRLGMLYYTVNQDFHSVLSKITLQYPDIDIKRYYYQPQEVYTALIEERIDIGVLPRGTSIDSNLLSYHDFYRGKLEVMMAADHPLASKSSLNLEDLSTSPCIFLKDDPISNKCYQEILARSGFTARETLLVGNLDSVPGVLLQTNAIYIKAAGFQFPGFEQTIVVRPIAAKNLYVPKSYAYRADNSNPLIPIFLSLAPSI